MANALPIKKLILVPAVITLAVTLLRVQLVSGAADGPHAGKAEVQGDCRDLRPPTAPAVSLCRTLWRVLRKMMTN